MATDRSSSKPFNPDEIQKILRHLQQPAVFTGMSSDWPALQWTAEHLCSCLGDKLIRFRLGRKEERNEPQFETRCAYVEATLEQFLRWTRGHAAADVGSFCRYSISEYWAYADYKYIAVLFRDRPDMFEDVRWCDFGFEGRNGRESTLWIGTDGANTPCHQDSYGYNLVLQVQGRKRWHLFPPEDAARLYPARIPYEESSVFSQVDVLHPDLARFPAFAGAGRHAVTLQPGQVLCVPRHWWHYVESVDPVTVSVNSWIELDVDDVTRVGEAVAKVVVFALKGASSGDNADDWLNPTEERVTSHDENMQYLNLALRAVPPGRSDSTRGLRDERPLKRDCRGQPRERDHVTRGPNPFSIPFGPNLVPVCRLQNSNVGPEAAPESARTPDGADGCAEGCAEGWREAERRPVTTNDLLDCLAHPDVIARVTELLLERHAGSSGSSAPS